MHGVQILYWPTVFTFYAIIKMHTIVFVWKLMFCWGFREIFKLSITTVYRHITHKWKKKRHNIFIYFFIHICFSLIYLFLSNSIFNLPLAGSILCFLLISYPSRHCVDPALILVHVLPESTVPVHQLNPFYESTVSFCTIGSFGNAIVLKQLY